ncbi:unnamed protein product [Caenorhabditis nigoni]
MNLLQYPVRRLRNAPPVNGCNQGYATCSTLEGCPKLLADTPNGQVPLPTPAIYSFVEVFLDCDADGTFSFGSVKGINKIKCALANC